MSYLLEILYRRKIRSVYIIRVRGNFYLTNHFYENKLYLNSFGLNMFLVPTVSVNFEISPSLKLYTNLAIHLNET